MIFLKINSLLKKLKINTILNNHEILNVTDDSTECINNSIFVAINGKKIDGHEKIDEAIANGAKTIFIERKVKYKRGINFILVNDTKYILAKILSIYNDKILKKLTLIGIIGTNAKTTTSTLVYNLLNNYKRKSMLIGSNGCYADNYYKKHDNTTPKATLLYKYFSYAVLNDIKYIIMEVSSISISELRVACLEFDTLIFTNFTEDHLDYHQTMESYFFSKAIPFLNQRSNQHAIINADDEKSKFLTSHINSIIYTYSKYNCSMIKPHRIINKITGLEFDYANTNFITNLIGSFNIYNILPLFAIGDIYGVKIEDIHLFLSGFKGVDGRMTLYEYNDAYIIIDYAHTEFAVNSVLNEAKSFNKGNVFVVIGCGGNREKEKRAKIGKLLSDSECYIILTNDNPRFENPMDIINEIKSGINRDVTIIENRFKAIEYAMNKICKNDILLILGKGVEDYIDIEGRKEKYSDIRAVESLINKYSHNI